MPNTKEKLLIPIPDEMLEEVADILDSNFNYTNNVELNNPEEFTDKYGQELYDETIEIFREKWFASLGEAIQYAPTFEECLVEAINADHRKDIQKQAERFH